MRFKTLKNTDIQVSAIIMGCWQAGKGGYWQNIDDAESVAAIRAAFDAGITSFDTAPGYGEGHSERILAKAVGEMRQKVVIATKVFPGNLRYAQVLQECEQSLKNLNTDYIDLYQVHWPSGAFNSEIVPIEETMRAFNDLKQAGKIRAIGVSNFSLLELQEAMQYAEIASIQPPYSLFLRHIEQDLLPFCKEHDILNLAYSPLAQGLLTGRYTRTHHFPQDEFRAKNKLCEPEIYEVAQQALDQLKPIAEAHKISLSQLALAWVIAQPNSCAIAGARSPEQVRDNAKAGSVKLSSDTLAQMSEIGAQVYRMLNNTAVPWDL